MLVCVIGAGLRVLGQEALDVFSRYGVQVPVTEVPREPFGHGQVGEDRLFFVNEPGGTQARAWPPRTVS